MGLHVAVAADVALRSLNSDSSSDDDDDSACSDEDTLALPPAAADVGPDAFLPAREPGAGSYTWAAVLADMSDDEDPWYLDDLRTWNPKRWHDNSAEENKLLLGSAPTAAAED